jgi:hypothetical protein
MFACSVVLVRLFVWFLVLGSWSVGAYSYTRVQEFLAEIRPGWAALGQKRL